MQNFLILLQVIPVFTTGHIWVEVFIPQEIQNFAVMLSLFVSVIVHQCYPFPTSLLAHTGTVKQ
jgi:hypothetical protein